MLEKIKTFLKWTYGIFLPISGLSIFTTSVVGGLLFIIAGLIILPPSLKFIEQKIGKPLDKSLKYGLAIGLFFTGAFFIGSNQDEKNKEVAKHKEEEFSKLPKEKQDSILAVRKVEDSLKLVQQAKEKEAELKAKRTETIKQLFSAWDGSHRGLTNYIKKNMNDPDSYEHIETSYWDMDDHLVVLAKFRGNNAFGGKVINIVKAKVDLEGNLIEIMETR